jgi:hypothetical protein
MPHSYVDEILPGIDLEKSPNPAGEIDALQMGKMPKDFPRLMWNEAINRYGDYWHWWSGEGLAEIVGRTDKNEPLYKYPLKINPVRTYSRIHNNMLWGETTDDNMPQVTTRILAEPSFMTGKPSDSDKKLAKFYERLISYVWQKSNARAILWEGGLLSQFLGGIYYQISYQPWRKDLKVPLLIRMLKPDFVLPIPNPDDPFDLLECWIVYRMTPASAREYYGQQSVTGTSTATGGSTYATYVEHWTRDQYTVYINGEPLEALYDVPGYAPVKVSYDHQPNPFGVVPVVYIPRIREGNFYGSAITPDIVSLMTERNSRLADIGDMVMQNSHLHWFGRNIYRAPKPMPLDGGTDYLDLGQSPPNSGEPEIWAETPPNLTESLIHYGDSLEVAEQREAFISPMAFGIDEGSQRSGTTLQIRMWPTISMARSQRNFWTCGLDRLAQLIIHMLSALKFSVDGQQVSRDHLTMLVITQVWAPYLPRDEEQATNRIVLLKQSGAMSTRRAVELQQDVVDVDEEVELIEADQKAAAELATIGNDQGADMKPESPVATTDVEDGA